MTDTPDEAASGKPTPPVPAFIDARFSTGELTLAPQRYRLVWAAMCPQAHRAVIVWHLLGLDDAISLAEVDSVRGPLGWEFSLDENHLDPKLGIRYLSEAYRAASPDWSGPSTVPALVDLANGHVVMADDQEIPREFETAWAPFHSATSPDLYPEELRPHIDALNAVLNDDLFGGVRLVQQATTQEEYDAGFERVFKRLNDLDDMLSTSRFLFGPAITDADVNFFTFLVRFDVLYYASQGVNWRRLGEYPHLWDYARDLYQTPHFGSTTDVGAIKRASFLTNREANPHGIVWGGPDTSGWNAPSPRATLTPVHAPTAHHGH